jgi:hypothetical protein
MTPHDRALPKEETRDIVERLRNEAHLFELHDPCRGVTVRSRVDVDSMREAADEIDRLRTALRSVRARTDPKWQAQIISDALRETP